MIEFFLNLDNSITNTITWLLPTNNILDYFFLSLSFNWLILVLATILGLILYHLDSKDTKKFIIYFFISFALTGILVNIVIKNIIQRERPYIANQIETYYCPDNFSFPSGHTTTAFVGAVIFSFFDKKRKWFYYALAILIGLSRIYLHCHYFFDVFFGALIGYIISKVALLNITDSE